MKEYELKIQTLEYEQNRSNQLVEKQKQGMHFIYLSNILKYFTLDIKSLNQEIQISVEEKEKELEKYQIKSLQHLEDLKKSYEAERKALEAKVKNMQEQLNNKSANNITVVDTTVDKAVCNHSHSISMEEDKVSLSFDMRRLAYLKQQEEENINLKEIIRQNDEKYQSVLEQLCNKINRKENKVKDLEKQLKDMKKVI